MHTNTQITEIQNILNKYIFFNLLSFLWFFGVVGSLFLWWGEVAEGEIADEWEMRVKKLLAKF